MVLKKRGLISLEKELCNTKSFDRFDDQSRCKLKRIAKTQDSRLTSVKQDNVALYSVNKKPKLSCSTKVANSDNFYSDLGRAQAVPVKATVRGTGKKGVVQHAREIQKKQQQLELEKVMINQEAKLKLQKQREAERIALERMIKTVVFNENLQVLRDLRDWLDKNKEKKKTDWTTEYDDPLESLAK